MSLSFFLWNSFSPIAFLLQNTDSGFHQLFGSNHNRGPNTHVMRFLERNNIPYYYFHTTNENKREGEILELVLNTDFLVLARYMQVNQVIRFSLQFCFSAKQFYFFIENILIWESTILTRRIGLIFFFQK